MFFILYFISPLQYTALWITTLGVGETDDFKFLSLLKVIELPTVKDIYLIIWNAKVYISVILEISTVSNGAGVTIFEFKNIQYIMRNAP